MSAQALRAADVDRARVADRLRQAHDEGRISLAEFDERVAAAYAAVTYDELGPLTADLPAREVGVRRSGCGSSRGRAVAFRIESAAWLFASLVNLMIWALVSVGAGAAVYPWWIWVAGPWGMVLLLRRIAPRRYAGR
ncbi:DUF1707 domain-containing protein [Pseudonocardia eucalypti]|uniref:DUF1707 domain-containing protein n=1 Tax=Pseudonocardia eucalypti TaxID=648755 RepID=A0ABP9PJ00_9PSEU|nr:hypothetical protein [Pseudonocardia eucalypti]